MLVNPYSTPLDVVPGTRVLQEQLGLTGAVFDDPKHPDRYWQVVTAYAPLPGRALGGIRARVIDNKQFSSFVNQRDLELLLDIASPGGWCPWANELYPGINDEVEGWFGLCADKEDLVDDLFERELHLRVQHPGGILQPQEMRRLIHLSPRNDVEYLDLLLWDADPTTGLGPDPRLETVERRWAPAERTQLIWDRLP